MLVFPGSYKNVNRRHLKPREQAPRYACGMAGDARLEGVGGDGSDNNSHDGRPSKPRTQTLSAGSRKAAMNVSFSPRERLSLLIETCTFASPCNTQWLYISGSPTLPAGGRWRRKMTMDQISSSLSMPLEPGIPDGQIPLSITHFN